MQLAIALYDRLTALDAIGPYEVLSRVPGIEVVFVAEEARVHRTDTGALGLVADATFDEVARPDVLLVPGGPGNRTLLDPDTTLVRWIRDAHPTTTWTTSVCTGALALAAAGVLDGLDATTHWNAVAELESAGVRYLPERVVERGKVLTAAGVSAGIDLGLTLAARLAGDDVARAIQLGIEYDPAPPFDAGSPAGAGPELVELVRSLTSAPDPAVS